MCGVAVSAGAQVTTTSRLVAKDGFSCTSLPALCSCTDTSCETAAETLTRHLTEGDSSTLNAYAWELMQTLASRGSASIRAAIGDIHRNRYRLIWTGRGQGSDPSVYSLLVHENPDDDGDRLPGISGAAGPQLLDVFISSTPAASLHTQYVSSRTPDPLTAQVPDFVEQSGILAFVGSVRRPLTRGAAEREPAGGSIAVYRASLPIRRAAIVVHDTVVTPATAADFLGDVVRVADDLKKRDARLSPCARNLADADVAAIRDAVQQPACAAPEPAAIATTAAANARACRGVVQRALDRSYDDAIARCTTDGPAIGGVDPMLAVDQRLRDATSGLNAQRLRGDSKLTNAPLTRFTFGLLSAVTVAAPRYFGGAARVKVSDRGGLVEDPLPSLLNLAIVNIHPTPYDRAEDSLSWAERVRMFAGTVIRPDFGVAGGLGIGVIRGLSVNVGWANVFVRAPKDRTRPVSEISGSSANIGVGHAGVWFAGLSYSFR
jgi:hypothetical protein